MNVAGRKMVGSMSTPFRPGSQVVEGLLDVAGDFQRVAGRLLLDDQEQALAVVDHGVADRRREADLDVGHVAQPERGAVAEGDGRPGEVARASRSASGGGRRSAGWACRRSPPPATAAVSVTALTTVSSVTPLSRSRSGSTSTWYCRSRWPQIATFATPGIAISRGRIVHLARIVRSICESVFDETPILSSRLVDDSGERITGGWPPPAAAAPRPPAAPARPAAPPSGRSPP